MREKDDTYFVDCSITSSSERTSKDSKFSLLSYFKYAVFLEIEKLVGPDRKYVGYTPIIQGDNARPYTDTKYTKYMKEHYQSKR